MRWSCNRRTFSTRCLTTRSKKSWVPATGEPRSSKSASSSSSVIRLIARGSYGKSWSPDVSQKYNFALCQVKMKSKLWPLFQDGVKDRTRRTILRGLTSVPLSKHQSFKDKSFSSGTPIQKLQEAKRKQKWSQWVALLDTRGEDYSVSTAAEA